MGRVRLPPRLNDSKGVKLSEAEAGEGWSWSLLRPSSSSAGLVGRVAGQRAEARMAGPEREVPSLADEAQGADHQAVRWTPDSTATTEDPFRLPADSLHHHLHRQNHLANSNDKTMLPHSRGSHPSSNRHLSPPTATFPHPHLRSDHSRRQLRTCESERVRTSGCAQPARM